MKSGQAWGFDLIAALAIFVSGMIFFYFYSVNYSGQKDSSSVSIQQKAEFIADSLLTEGFPENWNENNVERIGIYDNDKINQTKLEMFYFLSDNNYQNTKEIFNLNDEFYIRFPGEVNIDGNNVESFGNIPTEFDNLIVISRVVVYENQIRTMEVVVWN